MLGFYLSRLVSNLVGNLYPAYASYKAVLSKDAKAHKQWLMFWIVSTVFTVFEMFGEVLVSWLPLYYEAKILFVLWLTLPLPQFKGPGAAVLYAKIVEPMLTKWEPAIDEYKDRVMGAAIEKFGEARKVGEKVLRKGLREGIRRGSKLMAGAGAAEEDGGETTQEPPAPTAPAADVVDLADSDEVPH